jgi:hypothetical protein
MSSDRRPDEYSPEPHERHGDQGSGSYYGGQYDGHYSQSSDQYGRQDPQTSGGQYPQPSSSYGGQTYAAMSTYGQPAPQGSGSNYQTPYGQNYSSSSSGQYQQATTGATVPGTTATTSSMPPPSVPASQTIVGTLHTTGYDDEHGDHHPNMEMHTLQSGANMPPVSNSAAPMSMAGGKRYRGWRPHPQLVNEMAERHVACTDRIRERERREEEERLRAREAENGEARRSRRGSRR